MTNPRDTSRVPPVSAVTVSLHDHAGTGRLASQTEVRQRSAGFTRATSAAVPGPAKPAGPCCGSWAPGVHDGAHSRRSAPTAAAGHTICRRWVSTSTSRCSRADAADANNAPASERPWSSGHVAYHSPIARVGMARGLWSRDKGRAGSARLGLARLGGMNEFSRRFSRSHRWFRCKSPVWMATACLAGCPGARWWEDRYVSNWSASSWMLPFTVLYCAARYSTLTGFPQSTPYPLIALLKVTLSHFIPHLTNPRPIMFHFPLLRPALSFFTVVSRLCPISDGCLIYDPPSPHPPPSNHPPILR